MNKNLCAFALLAASIAVIGAKGCADLPCNGTEECWEGDPHAKGGTGCLPRPDDKNRVVDGNNACSNWGGSCEIRKDVDNQNRYMCVRPKRAQDVASINCENEVCEVVVAADGESTDTMPSEGGAEETIVIVEEAALEQLLSTVEPENGYVSEQHNSDFGRDDG